MTPQTATSAWQKIASVFLGLILSLVVLEAGLRLGGFILTSIQESGNLRSIKQKGAYRILCLGESTTAGQYPHLLEQILNQRNAGVRFKVIDKGKPRINTLYILSRIESYVAEYHPDMVVAMMGNNDQGVQYYEDIPESDTWLFKHCRVYRFGRMLFMHILRKIKREDIYGLSGSDPGRKAKSKDKGIVSEKTNLPKLDLKDAEGTRGPTSPYLNGGRISKSEESLKKAVGLHPKNAYAFRELGRLYQERGQLPQAEDLLEKVILLDPGNETAYAELEKLYRLQGKVFQPEDFFKKAIVLDPENDKAYVGLGRSYLLQKKFFPAEDSFKKAIELDPGNANAYVGLGWLYRDRDELSQAEDFFKKAIVLDPENDHAYEGLGRLYQEQGESSQAEDSYRKVIELDPENDHAYKGLGRLYHERGELSQAEAFYRKAIEFDPENTGTYTRLGWLYLDQGKFSQAEDSYRKVIDLDPENDNAYVQLGWLYQERGELSQAEDSYRRAFEINPKNESLLGEMVSLCEKMGKLELAKEYSEKAKLLLRSRDCAVTVSSYRRLKEILDRRGIKLVCVQYPMRGVGPLKRIFEKDKGVIFVDNESIFKEALKKGRYTEYFMDMFAGDFGHCTPKGNELLAQNIANVILKEVFRKR